ncbi:MAG: DNA recombination protein RmuC, partial [Muribaculaceae bacterium]|nr:DNA recombination protein RmuC [Muribaculaceae bacterium]
GRKLAIDAKCSLTDYLRSLEATDNSTRDNLLKSHVRSVESHFRGLADKQYNTLIGDEKISFTVMFMPHEGAFAAAMQHDGTLWQRAFERNVVIVSPTLLTVLIKLVEQMWVREDRDNNSRRIAEEAARMLDKLYAAFEDLLKAGRDIDRAAESCRAAMSKLNQGPGNVVTRAKAIVAMGARPSKQMPPGADCD